MARAVVLGSGTSNGVPGVGFDYSPEFLANPKNHRSRCCLLLEGPKGNVLVDCGPELRLQLTGAGVTDLDAVIVTHTHADHFMGMDDLRGFCVRYGRPFPVFSGKVFHEAIRTVFSYAFLTPPDGISVPQFELHDVEPVLELGGLEIETFWVDHGSMPCLGVKVGRFAYISDVREIPAEVVPMLTGLDVLVLDAVRHKPHPHHFHVARALETAEALGAGTTYLTHLSHEFDHDVYEAGLPAGVRLAYDGLEIPL